MKRVSLAAIMVVLAIPQVAAAQDRNLESKLGPYLAPPEIVMRHQRQLNITDDQRETISAMVSELQSGVVDLQWQLEGAGQELIEAVSREPVDIDTAIELFERVLEIEASIKRNHIRLLLEIRSSLNTEQRRLLQEIVTEMMTGEYREDAEEEHAHERESRGYNPIP